MDIVKRIAPFLAMTAVAGGLLLGGIGTVSGQTPGETDTGTTPAETDAGVTPIETVAGDDAGTPTAEPPASQPDGSPTAEPPASAPAAGTGPGGSDGGNGILLLALGLGLMGAALGALTVFRARSIY
jgi:hypothetical protein